MSNIQPEVLKTLRSNALQKINQGKRRTHTFNVDFSDINPKFVGRFTVHYPSQMERLQIGALKSQLLGGNLNVDTLTDNIATIISTLDVVLDDHPDWFDPFSDELDYDIMEAVYLEYIQWVNSFRKRDRASQPQGDSQNIGSEIPMVDTNNVPGTTNGQ